MPRSIKRQTIRTFDDFVEESMMLPDGKEPDFAVTDPLEQYFFNVADKHGVIDQLLNPDCDPFEE